METVSVAKSITHHWDNGEWCPLKTFGGEKGLHMCKVVSAGHDYYNTGSRGNYI